MPDNWLQWVMYGFFLIEACGGWLVLAIIGVDAWKSFWKVR